MKPYLQFSEFAPSWLCVLVLAFLAVFQSGHPSEAQSVDGPLVVLGSEQAPVEVIEIVTMTCTLCRAFHDGPGFEMLHDKYVEGGTARWIIRDHAANRIDLWQSLLLRCGDQPVTLQKLDHLFDLQPMILRTTDPSQIAQRLRGLSSELGLTPQQIETCFSNTTAAQSLVETQQKYIKSKNLGENWRFRDIFFSPLVMANGRVVEFGEGRVSMTEIVSAIDAAIEVAAE